MTGTAWYAAVLHVSALAALVVLVAIGRLSWAEGGPIIGNLTGLAIGVPLTINARSSTGGTPPKPPA